MFLGFLNLNNFEIYNFCIILIYFVPTWVYGAACHETGQSYAVVLPCANTKAMNIFLQGLSKEIKKGKHVALIIDNAGWHNSNELIVPDNITLIPLPPYSPELNAMGQV